MPTSTTTSTPPARTALHAAYALHQGLPDERPKPADEPAYTKWQRANSARASLANDSWPHKVLAFRLLMEAHIQTHPRNPMPANVLQQHYLIAKEEWDELWDAAYNNTMPNNLVPLLDGAIDCIYTILDLLVARGIHPSAINAAFEEIHASNMTKVDEDGRAVIRNGKIQKTAQFTPPNLPRACANAVPPFPLED